MVTTSYNSDN